MPRTSRGQRVPLGLALFAGAAWLAASLSQGVCWAAQTWGGSRPQAPGRAQAKVQMLAAAVDSFDPWTALGIPMDASVQEARKAYKKLITKYHPDVDPSPAAEEKFQQVVRAHAIITGEDRDLDTTTLLKNAVSNLRNDIEFREQQIKMMQDKAEEEKSKIAAMKEQLSQAEEQQTKVTQELGAYGGGTLGLFVAGPTGAVVGAALGLALKDREDALGQVIRGVGTLTKGVVDAVGKSIK